MPKALNTASKLAKFDYILISHDDFYYCPSWDSLLMNEVKLIEHKYFYLSGTMVGAVDKINLKKRYYPPILMLVLIMKNLMKINSLIILKKLKFLIFKVQLNALD